MFLDNLVVYIPQIVNVIVRGFLIFLISLGMVYIVGRMLNIVTSIRGKNLVALFIMVGLSYWSVWLFDWETLTHPHEAYWLSLLYITSGSVLYVLIGFDLYVRFNAWCDKKFGPAEGETKDASETKKTRRKTKTQTKK